MPAGPRGQLAAAPTLHGRRVQAVLAGPAMPPRLPAQRATVAMPAARHLAQQQRRLAVPVAHQHVAAQGQRDVAVPQRRQLQVGGLGRPGQQCWVVWLKICHCWFDMHDLKCADQLLHSAPEAALLLPPARLALLLISSDMTPITAVTHTTMCTAM